MKRKNFKLLEAILAKGLRQADLVQKAGLGSESRLSRIVNFLVLPTDDEVKRICEVLEVDQSIVRGAQNEF
jgi:transcriptional regulator with XRE-family HTH domain